MGKKTQGILRVSAVIHNLGEGFFIETNKKFPYYADTRGKKGTVVSISPTRNSAVVKFEKVKGRFEIHDNEFDFYYEKPMKKYLVKVDEYERFGGGNTKLEIYKATDLASLLEKAAEGWVEGKREEHEDEGKKWIGLTPQMIKDFKSNNGDGDDYYQIYELMPNDKLKVIID